MKTLTKIALAVASFLIASLGAFLLLAADLLIQMLFVVPVTFYLFRLLTVRLVQDAEGVPTKTWRFPVIDILAMLCGLGLFYLGITGNIYNQSTVDNELVLQMRPRFDRPSLIVGVLLFCVALFRPSRWLK